MKKKLSFGFIIAIGVLVFAYWGISSKAYPVATVNDSFISTRLFQLAGTAAQTYYENVSGIYGGLASTTEAEFQSRMRQVALQALIEDEIVTMELLTIFEAEPLRAAVDKRVAEALASSSQTTPDTVRALFGLTLDEFNEVVLAPRARLELLETELARSGESADFWLQAALRNARVSISVSDLAWSQGRVELTGEAPYTAKVKDLFEQLASTTELLQIEAEMSEAASSSVQ
jgi:hypothetical protein